MPVLAFAVLALGLDVAAMAQVRSSPNQARSGAAEKSGSAGNYINVTATAGVAMPGVVTEAVAWGDYDGDGDVDVYFANQGPNKLFRNNLDGFIEALTIVDNVGDPLQDKAAAFGDVANQGPNKLARNSQDTYFEDVTLIANVGDPRHGKAAAFGDFDNDGDLDLYVVNSYGESDVLYRNELVPTGVAVFTDVSSTAGLTETRSQGAVVLADVNSDGRLDAYVAARGKDILYKNLGAMQFIAQDLNVFASPTREGSGVVAADFDDNGWIDIFATNRNGEPAQLLMNVNGTLTNRAIEFGIGAVGEGSGVLAIDYNRDRRFDLFWGRQPIVAGREKPNELYRNDGNNTFTEVAATAGTQDLFGWAMGCNAADYDNDGQMDFFLANGGSSASASSVLYRNVGGGLFLNDNFEVVGGTSGDCRGVAFADYDNDGDMDLCVTGGAGTETRLWRNDLPTFNNNWVKVALRGRVSNRTAIGARVEVIVNNASFVQDVSGGAGLGSQNEQRLHFGVGATTVVDFVKIRWPNGRTQLLSNVSVNQTIDVIEPTPTADLDRDGRVGVGDLLLLLASWGECLNCAADLNSDGAVTLPDLLDLLNSFSAVGSSIVSPFPTPVSGWTPLTTSPDSIVIYVSSSEGDDANTGLSPLTPVRSLGRGVSLVRNGFPDWLLLKRGDVWIDESFGTWTRSGRSGEEPAVIGSYGADAARPFIMSGAERAIVTWDGADFVAIVGLHFEPSPGNPAGTNGVAWRGRTGGLLLEDLYVAGYKKNLQIQNDADVGPIENVVIRRCIIVDSQLPNSQGIYAWNAAITIDECVFDRNGYLPAWEIHNHGLYLDGDAPYMDYTVRRTVVTRSGSQGFKVQPKGGEHEVSDNLCIANPIHMGIGGIHSSQTGPGLGIDVLNNVLLEPTDIEGQPRGWGIILNNLVTANVQNNILAHRDPALFAGPAILAGDPMFGSDGAGINNLMIQNNIIHNWLGSVEIRNGDLSQYSNITIRDNTIQNTTTSNNPPLIDVFELPLQITQVGGNSYYSSKNQSFTAGGQDMSYAQWLVATQEMTSSFGVRNFVDPNRTIASYMISIGAGLTLEDFVNAARQQAKGTGMGLVDGQMTVLPAAPGAWRVEFDATTVNAYIRAGFQ